MREMKPEVFGERREEIRGQLAIMDDWLEKLLDGTDAREVMRFFVAYLRRDVLGDVAWEDTKLFPVAGSAASILRAEHAAVTAWARELHEIAHAEAPDAERFRSVALKLMGVLEAHLESEAAVLNATPTARRTMPSLMRR